jgi:hypothetical protein
VLLGSFHGVAGGLFARILIRAAREAQAGVFDWRGSPGGDYFAGLFLGPG